MVFTDYAKAFDSLEETLINNRIYFRYKVFIHNIHQDATITVKLDEALEIGLYPIKRGIRLEDKISSKLFTLPLEDLFKTLNWKHKGTTITR